MKIHLKGGILIEVLLAGTIGVMLIIGVLTLITSTPKRTADHNRLQAGVALGKELLDKVVVFAEGNWHNLASLSTSSANRYYLNASNSPFIAVSGEENIIVASTTYTRYFYVDEARRDASGYIVASGGTVDHSTRRITVVYTWSSGEKAFSTYLVRFRNIIYRQTDWFGGAGQDGPVTSTNSFFATSTNIHYTTTTGSIFLSSNATSGMLDSTTYDTGFTDGAQLNSVIWQGDLPGGTEVRLQFAVSSSSSGPWAFLGPDGTSSTHYSAGVEVSTKLNPEAHRSRRYFRYRLILVPNSAQTLGPRVDEVIVSFSP